MGGISVDKIVFATLQLCVSVLQVLSICPKDMRADICVHLNRKVCISWFSYRHSLVVRQRFTLCKMKPNSWFDLFDMVWKKEISSQLS